jgi:mannose-6-phosphate isomerase-like protein (cupin superfamily)
MSDLHETVRIEKPWGYELIWARTDRYVGKILHLRAGEALSLQYHRVKDETIRLLSGRLRLEIGAAEERRVLVLDPGAGVHIHPGLHHRMEAIEDCDVLEVSTPELDDVVRLEDRYGRVDAAERPRRVR